MGECIRVRMGGRIVHGSLGMDTRVGSFLSSQRTQLFMMCYLLMSLDTVTHLHWVERFGYTCIRLAHSSSERTKHDCGSQNRKETIETELEDGADLLYIVVFASGLANLFLRGWDKDGYICIC